ncbi:phage/plasmid primase, P4 family [Roseovarius sp. C03]|uniref:phage/plasmid primase, P4 family n=1 Tax=Roseovarius sp. C03 TaxID=3449222 RepID=UPI003EDC26B5
MSAPQDIKAMFQNAEEIYPADHAGGEGPPPEPPEEEPIEARCAHYPQNDRGNGQRFVAYYGEDTLFAPRVGWHTWTGQVWRLDDDKLDVRRMAQKVSERILDEIVWIAADDTERAAMDEGDAAAEKLAEIEKKDELLAADRKEIRALRPIVERGQAARAEIGKRKRGHRSHAKGSGNSGSINNMLIEASVDVAVPVEDMNADKLAINTRSGLVRLVEREDVHESAWKGAPVKVWSYELLPHDRAHYISKIMPVEFIPDAPRPVFDKFLARVQPDPDLRDFLKRWFGYSITGLTGEQKLVFMHGQGRNGKSTLVDCIAEIMADYATTLPIETLIGAEQRKGSDATPDLVRVPGARMIRASEPEEGKRMKEAFIKQITGGEAMLIRKMQQEFIEIKPEFKLTIQGNHKPEIHGGDDGIWRRMLLVPFDVQIPEEEVDRLLGARLREEAPGIFNWMLEGAIEYLQDGLQIPDAIRAATADYRSESDPVGVFLKEECVISGLERDEIPARDVIDAFILTQQDDEGNNFTPRRVSKLFKAKSGGAVRNPDTGAKFEWKKTNGRAVYRGLCFNPSIAARLAEWREQQRFGGGGGFS